MTTDTTTTNDTQPTTYRGRRISWAELYRQRPDLRPANQNDAIPLPQATLARRQEQSLGRRRSA